MLTRIQLKDFKSFESLDLRLNGPLAVVFGPNASGKSNLLDALQLLSHLVTVRDLSAAFRAPFRGTALEACRYGYLPQDDGSESASCTLGVDVRIPPDVVAAVLDFAEAWQGERPKFTIHDLRYSIQLAISRRTGRPFVTHESVRALSPRGSVLDRKALAEPMDPPNQAWYSCRREGRGRPREVYTGGRCSLLSLDLSPYSHPHLVALRAMLSRYRFFAPNPRGAVRERGRLEATTQLDVSGDNLASYLATLRDEEPRQYDSLRRSLQMVVPQVADIKVEVTTTGELDLWLQQNGAWVPARLVSDGTLRLLALLASVSNTSDLPTIVGFEEPENGIHPRRIALLGDFLKAQAALGGITWLVTTHSPILPELLPNECLYVCRQSDAATSIVPFRDADPLTRRGRVDVALDDQQIAPLGERIRRGDFDA